MRTSEAVEDVRAAALGGLSPPVRILFISHEATRTGAPIVLLHFLRWLAAQTNVQFEVVLGDDGVLRPEFERIAPVHVLQPWTDEINAASLIPRVRRRLALSRLAARPWDAVYSNTISNGGILHALGRRTPPAICHVHELDTTIAYYGRTNFDKVQRHTRRYVACAHVVKNNLVENYGIDGRAIDVVHEFIPMPSDASDRDVESRRRVCAEIGVAPDSLIVGAAGTTDWRKGSDLFVQVARFVRQRRPDLPTHFVWVGGDGPGTGQFAQLQHDIRRLGLDSVVHFLGQRANPLDYFRAFDVFALTSREDPFPLVCLEVASLGKPIVCFDGAGGEKEFVEDDCGFVVPYLALDAMADRLLELLESDDRRRAFGRQAAAKVRDRHDVAVVAPRLLTIITDNIPRASGGAIPTTVPPVSHSTAPGKAVEPS
jgi:glycosyltransferase involved in cell wall biosynthesis